MEREGQRLFPGSAPAEEARGFLRRAWRCRRLTEEKQERQDPNRRLSLRLPCQSIHTSAKCRYLYRCAHFLSINTNELSRTDAITIHGYWEKAWPCHILLRRLEIGCKSPANCFNVTSGQPTKLNLGY